MAAQTSGIAAGPGATDESVVQAEGRALTDFSRDFDAYPAERDLLEQCRSGEPCTLNDGKRPDSPEPALLVRAGFIRFLALGGDDSAPVHEHGIVLFGAWIEGTLDLNDVDLANQLQLECCHFQGLTANDASARAISLNSCCFETRLMALRLNCSFLSACDCLFEQGADFSNLHVESEVNFSSSRFQFTTSTPDADGRPADRVFVLELGMAYVGGNLICNNIILAANPSGSLKLELSRIKGYALLRRMLSEGPVSCFAAEVAGNLDFSGTCIQAGGLDCSSVKVGENLAFISGFVLGGALSLESAMVAGSLLGYSAPDPDLRYGRVPLPAMQIANASEMAVSASGARFKSARLDGGLFSGGLDFSDSFVEGNLVLSRALLAGRSGVALDLSRARVSGALYLLKLQACTAEISYATCVDRLQAARDTKPSQLSGSVYDGLAHGEFHLMQTQVGSLVDDFASWHLAKGKIDLDGFEYKRLTYPYEATLDPAAVRNSGTLSAAFLNFLGVDRPELRLGRVQWLRLQKPANLNAAGYRPQPWNQLATTLRAMGDLKDARRVAIAQQYQMRFADRFTAGERFLHYFFGLFTKFGYQPLRLATWLCVPLVVASALFWVGAHPDAFRSMGRTEYWLEPAKQVADFKCLASHAGKSPPPACLRTPSYSEFFPIAYAADTLLPIINLGYKSNWQPVLSDADGHASWGGWVVQGMCWFLIFIGWIGGAMLAAAIGALTRKD